VIVVVRNGGVVSLDGVGPALFPPLADTEENTRRGLKHSLPLASRTFKDVLRHVEDGENISLHIDFFCHERLAQRDLGGTRNQRLQRGWRVKNQSAYRLASSGSDPQPAVPKTNSETRPVIPLKQTVKKLFSLRLRSFGHGPFRLPF
jgi:hypothetical protein